VCVVYLPPTNRCCLSEASTLTASGDGLTGHKGGLAALLDWSVPSPGARLLVSGHSVRSGKSEALPHAVASLSRSLSTRGSKLMLRTSRWHPSRLVKASIAIGLAIMGTVLVWAALPRPSAPDSALVGAPDGHSMSTSPSTSKPASEGHSARGNERDVRDKVTGLVLPESDPVAVSIPKLGVRSKLIHLGRDKYGSMEVPQNAASAGWFSGGAAPGALGPAVIAGHVTWDGAPAVFHRLGTLRPGDRVAVARKDGRTAVFTVSRVDRFSKSRFPSKAVYGAIDHAGLRLITCGGTYDAARHRYLDNVVVFARLQAVRGPGG
jgi:sortase (surface protein transpeptidase)